jgi:hypothetical protein
MSGKESPVNKDAAELKIFWPITLLNHFPVRSSSV